jgi:hypothetical protein
MEILVPSRLSVMRKAVINDLYKIRDEIQKNFAVPTFEGDYDFYADLHSGVDESTNCYGYAMQIHRKYAPSNIGYPFLEPGFLSGEYSQPYNEKTLVRAFKSDCDFLDLDVKDADRRNPPKKDAYKIEVFFDFHKIDTFENFTTVKTAYHFTRQNADGTWSQKSNLLGPVEICDDSNIEGRYDFVGTYEISRKK